MASLRKEELKDMEAVAVAKLEADAATAWVTAHWLLSKTRMT